MKKILFKLIVLFVIVNSAFAANDVVTSLASLLSNVKTLKANFSQETYDARGKRTQKASGVMAVSRPYQFRWEIEKPIPQLIIVDKKTLWIYDKDLEQVTIRTLDTDTADAPALLLSYDHATLEKNYKTTAIPSKEDNIKWFSLEPKNKDNMFELIEVGFGSNKELKKMRLKDHLGNMTAIQFSNNQNNKPLNASLFTLKTPKGTDVIDERSRNNNAKKK